MKTNHVSCNMTNELKSLLKSSTVKSVVYLCLQNVWLQSAVAPAGGGSGSGNVQLFPWHTWLCGDICFVVACLD